MLDFMFLQLHWPEMWMTNEPFILLTNGWREVKTSLLLLPSAEQGAVRPAECQPSGYPGDIRSVFHREGKLFRTCTAVTPQE